MKTMTSAVANKMLKQLNNDLAYAYQQENQNNTYVRISGEEPVVPEYDIEKKREEVAAIQARIVKIKHALNEFNAVTTVPGTGLTIDALLVKMAMLNTERNQLAGMRGMAPQKPRQTIRCTSNLPEYDMANFDPKVAGAMYDKLAKEIADIQLALDTVNSTVSFQVDID